MGNANLNEKGCAEISKEKKTYLIDQWLSHWEGRDQRGGRPPKSFWPYKGPLFCVIK